MLNPRRKLSQARGVVNPLKRQQMREPRRKVARRVCEAATRAAGGWVASLGALSFAFAPTSMPDC